MSSSLGIPGGPPSLLTPPGHSLCSLPDDVVDMLANTGDISGAILKNLTYALVLHPIAAGITLVAMIVSLTTSEWDMERRRWSEEDSARQLTRSLHSPPPTHTHRRMPRHLRLPHLLLRLPRMPRRPHRRLCPLHHRPPQDQQGPPRLPGQPEQLLLDGRRGYRVAAACKRHGVLWISEVSVGENIHPLDRSGFRPPSVLEETRRGYPMLVLNGANVTVSLPNWSYLQLQYPHTPTGLDGTSVHASRPPTLLRLPRP